MGKRVEHENLKSAAFKYPGTHPGTPSLVHSPQPWPGARSSSLSLLCNCVLIDVVAVIITVVLIILLQVSSLASPGTAQTLAHITAVFTGKQKTTQAWDCQLPPWQKGALQGFCSAPNTATLSPTFSSKAAPELSLDLEE